MSEISKVILAVGEIEHLISFVKELISMPVRVTLENKYRKCNKISVVHSDELSDSIVILKDNSMEVFSILIPAGVKLVLDSSDNWYLNAPPDTEMVLFIIGYPYNSGHTEEKINKRSEFLDLQIKRDHLCTIKFRVVFCKNSEMCLGATDIDTPDTAICVAESSIRNLPNISLFPLEIMTDFSIFSMPSDILKVLVHSGCSLSIIENIGRSQFNDWQCSLPYFYDYYDFVRKEYDHLLDQELLYERIFKFKCIKNSNNIALTYSNLYFSYFFHELEELVDKVYMNSIKTICFWNKEKDIEILHKRLKDLYDNQVAKILHPPLLCPENEADYQFLIASKKIHIHFAEIINELLGVNGADSLIANMIMTVLDEKEKILSALIGDYTTV